MKVLDDCFISFLDFPGFEQITNRPENEVNCNSKITALIILAIQSVSCLFAIVAVVMVLFICF